MDLLDILIEISFYIISQYEIEGTPARLIQNMKFLQALVQKKVLDPKHMSINFETKKGITTRELCFHITSQKSKEMVTKFQHFLMDQEYFDEAVKMLKRLDNVNTLDDIDRIDGLELPNSEKISYKIKLENLPTYIRRLFNPESRGECKFLEGFSRFNPPEKTIEKRVQGLRLNSMGESNPLSRGKNLLSIK